MSARSGETELILVRHGETEWNHARRIQGQIDVPLSAVGLRQAEAAGRRFAAPGGSTPGGTTPGRAAPGQDVLGCVAVYTSDLLRASQTAAPIAAACGVDAVPDAGLRERHYGALQGRFDADIARDDPAQFARMQARDPADDLGGGETLPVFHARVHVRLEAIAARHPGGRVVVVTHGGVLDCAWRLATGAALDGRRDVGLFNASLNTVARSAAGWRLVAWGDIAHLSASADDLDPRGRAADGATRVA